VYVHIELDRSHGFIKKEVRTSLVCAFKTRGKTSNQLLVVFTLIGGAGRLLCSSVGAKTKQIQEPRREHK
jgi:hypothetical protein